MYSLSFNSDGQISSQQVYDALKELGWSSSDSSLNGIYAINLWEVTDEQMEAAKDALDKAFSGFKDVAF